MTEYDHNLKYEGMQKSMKSSLSVFLFFDIFQLFYSQIRALLQRVYIIRMNFKISIVLITIFGLFVSIYSVGYVNSFKQLAQHHCKEFPIQILYRLASGKLSQTHGVEYKNIDCYIRQFVNKDGQDPFQDESDSEEEQQVQEEVPDIDPIVEEYAQGLQSCLPEGADPVESVYAIWRFVRFVVQNDYALEWMRAKIRATLGYEAEKPNAWMDGEQSAPRLRLDKLFSNQFYEYVDKLMFRDFLHPFLTFLKKNVVFAASGQITDSGKAILVQYIESKNLVGKVFFPVVLKHSSGDIFSYTIPGIPLLLGGASQKLSWAFTGILVDRSNIEQIETLGNKFFHRDSQIWVKLQNVTQIVNIKDQQPFQCKFVHSSFGTLYEKHESQGGKISQYIARWHEKERKVRVIFSQLFELIISEGKNTKQMQFPFSSLVLANSQGIHQYICFQKHPSYFLYPDLSGAPEPVKSKWISNPKRNFIVVSNTHLTTQNQESYLKRQINNPLEEQFVIDARRKSSAGVKFSQDSLFQFVLGLNTDPLIKKRKDLLIHIYRKAKFLFFPEQNFRKECDQLIAVLQKWDNNLSSNPGSPIFILWDYFFRDYTFNHVSSDLAGLAIAKHKILTDSYWTNQMQLWKAGTSYGQCDSSEWDKDYRQRLNGTGENSTCYFNIMRGINRTRQYLHQQPRSFNDPHLSNYVIHKIADFSNGYLGNHIEEAFNQYYSKNLAFSAQIDSSKIIFTEGYLQTRHQINLSTENPEKIIEEPIDTDL